MVFIVVTSKMSDKCKIYKITNTCNGLNYIGCTIGKIEERFKEHLYRCFHDSHNSKLYNSIKKYGKENFKITLIEECEIEFMYEREKYYIKEYDTFKKGLNSTLGGDGCLGYTHSEEIRKKISENTHLGIRELLQKPVFFDWVKCQPKPNIHFQISCVFPDISY